MCNVYETTRPHKRVTLNWSSGGETTGPTPRYSWQRTAHHSSLTPQRNPKETGGHHRTTVTNSERLVRREGGVDPGTETTGTGRDSPLDTWTASAEELGQKPAGQSTSKNVNLPMTTVNVTKSENRVHQREEFEGPSGQRKNVQFHRISTEHPW